MKIKGLFPMSAVVACLLFVCFAFPACADDKADAVKMVKDAVAYMQANGMEKALDAINDKKGAFVKGDLYVLAYDTNGILMANAFRPDLLGQNLFDVPDSKGKKFRKEIVETAVKSGSGWVDYTYLNPKTKTEEQKTTYVEKAGDLVLGCGIYKK